VKHNIPLLINIVKDKEFIDGKMHTNSLLERKDLFQFPTPRDRATKILRFIADVTVNNPHQLTDKTRRGEIETPSLDVQEQPVKIQTAKSVFDAEGPGGLQKWIKDQKQLLLTDTTMRDAHQSLFATRMRSKDMLNAAPFYDKMAQGLFSLEVWGGATFDTCLRFIKEDPWERLSLIRQKCPNHLLQMLIRGDNAVGYTNYPEWVIRDFIKTTVENGLDLFRIFDCLNNPEQMAIAMDEVVKQGAIAEACLCYTGNVGSKSETKYTVDYYIKIAKQLESMGAHIICIKDMAGLLRPQGAKLLVSELKKSVDLPIHLHTHSTSGNAVAMLLAASEAGCDIVDGAVSSMSGLTSQPSLNSIVAALEDSEREPSIALKTLDDLGRYWETIRGMYQVFDPGIQATSTRVYEHEIPGGQYSNLYDQARRVGVSSSEFYELTERYREVNELFGNIVKVTPSSKVVGDMALLLQKNGLTGPQFLDEKPHLDYPDSVISFFRGHMGTPYQGFPKTVREQILGDEAADEPSKPVIDSSDSFNEVKKELTELMGVKARPEDVLSYRLYPKVFRQFVNHRIQFDKTDNLPTPNFFYGMTFKEEISLDLEAGKTLIIRLNGISEPNEKGERSVFFELNGYPRTIKVVDASAITTTKQKAKADLSDPSHLAANMPAKILELKSKVGDKVETGQTLLITESMKMEYALSAKVSGTIKQIHVKAGDSIEDGDLLVEITTD
ncbi:pyruvate carboxylase subunit B, partial [Oligoflexaceae bacterium]|nr:pyruvate carboxylase subunit B [Oligoflexaceae bacterium]